MKKHAKHIFYDNLETTIINTKSTDPRQYWRLIKILVKNSNENNIDFPPLRKTGDEYAFTDDERANVLNDYFVSISNIDDSNAILPNVKNNTACLLEDIFISET